MRQQIAACLVALLVLSSFAPVAAGSGASTATAATQVDCEYPIELTDATGETISLEEPPESVVALQASDAQTVFEIGAEDRLVGMPDSPATEDLEMGDRTAVTDGYEIDHERVIELDPDLVLAANITEQGDIDTLREAGLDVYHFDEAESIDDVRENVERTGTLTGECEGAAETVDWMDERLEVVETALEDADRPLGYYAMGAEGFTAGTETFVHDVLTTAGLENIAERADISGYNMLSDETIVDEDPEWIVHSDDAAREDLVPDAAEATTAAQNDNIVVVDADPLNQPAPQVIYAVVDIVEAVHPDAYEEAVEGLEGANNSTDDENETDEGDDAGDENEDTVPGFGIPAAVAAALAAVGLLARRR